MRTTLLGLTAAAVVTAGTLLASPAGAIDHSRHPIADTPDDGRMQPGRPSARVSLRAG